MKKFNLCDDVIVKGNNQFKGKTGRVVEIEVDENNNTIYTVAVLLGNYIDLCFTEDELELLE